MAQPRSLRTSRRSWWLGSLLRSEEHTSELQSHSDLVCRLLLEKKKCDKLDCARRVLLCSGRERGQRKFAVSAGGGRGPYFLFSGPATTAIYTLSLHDALPIWDRALAAAGWLVVRVTWRQLRDGPASVAADLAAVLVAREPAQIGRAHV